MSACALSAANGMFGCGPKSPRETRTPAETKRVTSRNPGTNRLSKPYGKLSSSERLLGGPARDRNSACAPHSHRTSLEPESGTEIFNAEIERRNRPTCHVSASRDPRCNSSPSHSCNQPALFEFGTGFSPPETGAPTCQPLPRGCLRLPFVIVSLLVHPEARLPHLPD
jgi:hypothetical protein